MEFDIIGGNIESNETKILIQNLSTSCKAHIQEANSGNTESLYYIGRSFIEGANEFPQNIKIGLRYIKRGSEMEDISSMEYYGSLLFKGDIIAKDEYKANSILMTAAIKYNSSNAKFLLAQIQMSHRTSGPNGFDDSKVNYVLAKEFAKEAADSTPKNPEAMVLYGLICQKEKNNEYGSITRNFKEAFKYFKEAADLGNEDAMVYVGNYYRDGYGVTNIDKKLAIRYYRLSSKSGNLNGCASYGGRMIDGDGIKENEREGLRLVKYSCDRGNPRGYVGYGYCLFYGVSDLPVDKIKASYYFKKAADAGYHMGMYNYAIDLRDGNGGVQRNIDEAIRYFKMAIDEGNIFSARILGILLCKGFKDENSNVILKPDPTEGNRYIKYAADHGDSAAMEEYAYNILNRKGVEFNTNELKKYLEMGVEAKNTFCMRYYGAILLDGTPFPKDVTQGARYYKMAVDLGDEAAMYTYGELLEEGLGVEKDLVKARKYYQLAADLGDKDGIESYARFLEQGIGGEKWEEEAQKYRKILA